MRRTSLLSLRVIFWLALHLLHQSSHLRKPTSTAQQLYLVRIDWCAFATICGTDEERSIFSNCRFALSGHLLESSIFTSGQTGCLELFCLKLRKRSWSERSIAWSTCRQMTQLLLTASKYYLPWRAAWSREICKFCVKFKIVKLLALYSNFIHVHIVHSC